jgi:hypothetical protein
LLWNFAVGYTNYPEIGKADGYPLWWLQEVGYEKGS